MKHGLPASVILLAIIAIALITTSFSGFKPTAFATISSCVALSDATNDMSANFSIAGSCLNTTTVGVELNCNGYAIVGSASGSGIQINASNVTIRNCIFDNFNYGINFTNVVNGTITNVTVHNATTSGIYLSNASNITITNVTISGLPVFGTATDNGIEIAVRSNYTTIKNTTIKYIQTDGISMVNANGTLINGSFFISSGSSAADGAIRSQPSHFTTITFNEFLNPLGSTSFASDAIVLLSSTNVTIENNTIKDYRNRGILIQDSLNITMRGNNFTNNSRNFNIVGDIDSEFNTHTFDESNVVKGNRPLRYYINVSNTTYSRISAGFFACIQCSNITVDKLDLKNQTGSEGSNGYGMFFWKINNSIISNNEMSYGVEGLWVQNSTNVNITNNTLLSTRMYLSSTTFSIVEGNNISSGGMTLSGGTNNITIANNTLRLGGCAISLTGGTPANNTIINNTIVGCTSSGVDIQTGATRNYIYNNTLANNTFYGVNLRFAGSTNNIIVGNNITGNVRGGISVSSVSTNTNITNNLFCRNLNAVLNATIVPILENNTFCVDQLSPSPSNYTNISSSISAFTFNVTNPVYFWGISNRNTSCSLWVDGSLKATNSSVFNNNISTIQYTPPDGSVQWQIYCNDSSGTNTGNSSVVLFSSLQASTVAAGSGASQSCPVCSGPTEWSVCKNGEQKRTTYACKSGACVSSEEKRACLETAAQTCPSKCQDSEPYSSCADGKRTRTAYKCSSETLYLCQSFAEAEPCGALTELQDIISSIEVHQSVWWISVVIVFLLFSKWLTDIRKVKNRNA